MSAARKIWTLLIAPYWKSEEKFKAIALFLAAILLNLASVWGAVRLNTFTRDLYNAFEQKSYPALLNQIYIFVALLFFIVFIVSSLNIVTGFLEFCWRRWLTNNFLSKWAKKDAYYHVMLEHNHIDNPDQRISQDLNSLASLSLGLVFTLLMELMSFVSFAVILWKISSDFSFKIGSHTYPVKGYLLWAALTYASIGTCFAVLVGWPLIKLDFMRERYEANFRFSLIRLQEKREETALYDGTSTEVGYLKGAFQNIQNNFYAILIRALYLNVYKSFYVNLDQLIPIVLVSPMYFAGAISLGIVMQVISAFGRVMSSLSVIVKQFSTIASWKASVLRLLEFVDNIAEANRKVQNNQIKISEARSTIQLRSVSLSTPTGREILRDVDLSITKGERLLLIGSSGIGKSTIIRALAGLWTYGSGELALPKERIFFVSQRPYMPIATLEDALIYPKKQLKDQPSKSEIIKLLQEMHLGYLVDQLYEHRDWGSMLSLGEQQRISFIRMLLHKPQWVVMDEPTSALNSRLQKLAFELLLSKLKNLTILTVGHDHELQSFHTRTIDGEKWSVSA